MKSQKRLIRLLMTFSLCGCASIKGPDTYLGIVNAPGKRVCGYNLKRDYDENGNRRSDAPQDCRPLETISDLNKWACTDIQGFTNLKSWTKEIREQFKHCDCR